MVSARSSLALLAICTMTLQGHADADVCEADNYSKVSTAVQTLHANCASWAAYLSNGGVWHCDSTCQQAVVSLVDTLPDCQYGGPYGQNYKQVVENLAEACDDQLSGSATTTTEAPSSTTAAPSATTATPTATTAAPETANSTTNETTEVPSSTQTDTSSSTKTITDTNDGSSASTSASASAGVVNDDTPTSDVSTTSGASSTGSGFAAPVTAMVLLVAGTLMQ